MKKIIHSLGCKSALLYFVFSLLTLHGQNNSPLMQTSMMSSSIKFKITDRSIPRLLKNAKLTELKNSDNRSQSERVNLQKDTSKILLVKNNSVLNSNSTAFKSVKNSNIKKSSAEILRSTANLEGNNNLQSSRISDVTQKNSGSENSISPFEAMKGKAEDLSKRDAVSKHYRNSDGSFTTNIAAGPIHYKKNGKWEDINGKINKESSSEYAFSNKENIIESYYGATALTGVKSTVKEGEVKEFLNTSMYWEKAGERISELKSSDVAARVSGEKLYYDNLYGNISAEFTTLSGGRKLNYIIPNREALGTIPNDADFLVFSEDIQLPSGWTHEVNQKGDVIVKDLKGESIFLYSKPTVLEEYKDFGILPEGENFVSYTVNQNSSILAYTIKIKVSWLLDNARKFPLGVDPTVLTYPNNANFWSGSANSDGTVGFNGSLYVGYSGLTEFDAFVRFNTSSIAVGSTISSSFSALYLYASSGALTGNKNMTVLDTVDPLDTNYYAEIFNGYSITSAPASVNFAGTAGYKTNTLNAAGLQYLQAGLQKGWASLMFYPSGNAWNVLGNNYGQFYSHTSTSNRPYLSITYTLPVAGYCIPVSQYPNELYINQVNIGGIYANPKTQNSTSDADGYEAYTTGALPTQAQGEGVNIIAYSTGNTFVRGTWKAWVDWNKNNSFEESEVVYNIDGFAGSSATFGFTIPPNQTPGNYRLRIRVNNGIRHFFTNPNNYNTEGYYENFGYDFLSCNNITFDTGTTVPDGDYDWYYGETEDYAFTVIDNCAAKITNIVEASRCGTGKVILGATATSGVTEFRWYSDAAMTNLVGTSAPDASFSTTWQTPTDISATTTYYVAAFSSALSCKSLFSTPITATVKNVPNLVITPASAEICGDNATVMLTANGGNEVTYLINENFEAGGLGVFSNVNNDANNGTIDNITRFQNRTSVFNPSTNVNVWYPAISSGFGTNKFALAFSDAKTPNYPNNPVQNALTQTGTVSTVGITNLTLKLKLYYSRYYNSGINPNDEYVAIEATNNNWGAVTTIATFTANQGLGSQFVALSYSVPALENMATLKIRVRHYSSASVTGWLPDGIAVDDIQLYGNKALLPSFTFTSSPTISLYTNATGTIPYTGGPTSVVYIKPTATELESAENWAVKLTATLSNLCDATGTVNIQNTSKIWNTASTDWATTSWKPNTTVPDADKCVIIKTPVNINAATIGFAKNVKIESAGKVQITGSLTVTDFINNLGNANALTLKSDANLIQINAGAANSGLMTAERSVTNIDYQPGTQVDYIYWSAPVTGQQTKGAGGFSPGTPNNRFFYYKESNDKFYETPDLTFVPGRGYAVQAENDKGTSYNKIYKFAGSINNGDISIPVTKSADNPVGVVHGYNLVGNPYPSNINFDELYQGNSALIWNTAYFWSNASYEQYQQGSAYGGNNYAVYNGTGFNPATTPTGLPDYGSGIVKVGQGFIVQAKADGNLIFKNSYSAGHDLRVKTTGTFFQRGEVTKNRYSLNLNAPTGIINTQLIGYIDGATDDFDSDYDAEAFNNSSDLFYSTLAGKKLLIQGKAALFTEDDQVNLGANFFKNGAYTINLDHPEGIFDGSQNIYLKDKQEGIITNLSQGSYTFNANSGDNATRFEIIYKPETILSAGEATKDDLIVYRDGNDFIVKSQSKKIDSLEMYDPAGRLLLTAQPKNKEAVIPAEKLINSMYILKINRNGEISTLKVRK